MPKKPNFSNADEFRSANAVPIMQPQGFLGSAIEAKEMRHEAGREMEAMFGGGAFAPAYRAEDRFRDNFTEPGSSTHTPGFKDCD